MYLCYTCTDISFCLYSDERVGKVALEFLKKKYYLYIKPLGTHTKFCVTLQNFNEANLTLKMLYKVQGVIWQQAKRWLGITETFVNREKQTDQVRNDSRETKLIFKIKTEPNYEKYIDFVISQSYFEKCCFDNDAFANR